MDSNMDASNKWFDIADVSVLNNTPHLLDLFPARPPPSSPAVAATEIPPPTNLAAGISAFNPVEHRHLLKRRDSCFPNPNPNSNPNQNAIPRPVQTVPYGNPAANREATKEARNKRIAKRRSDKSSLGDRGQGPVGNAAPRSGEDGQKQEEPVRIYRHKQEEHGMKFLLQRVLKRCDVGSLGRIGLPTKEAEDHLPVLESRGDGIVIPVEDLESFRVWDMRLRFLSRLRTYGFENTGDFVRLHGLQEGDFIVLYMNKKSSKYMIRPFKMPAGEVRPTSRRKHKNQA